MNQNDLINWCAINGVTHFKQFFTDFTFYRKNPYSGLWQWITVFRENSDKPFIFLTNQFGVTANNPIDLKDIQEFYSINVTEPSRTK